MYSHGIHLVGLNPAVHSNAELALQAQLLPVVLGHLGVSGHLLHLLEQVCVAVLNGLCGIENLAQVGRHHGDARSLEQLLARTAGIESERTRADLSDACMAQSVHHAAYGGKAVDVLCQERRIHGICV